MATALTGLLALDVVGPRDMAQLPPLLDAAFSRYQDALRYEPAVLDLFAARWWPGGGLGVVAREGDRVVGVALAGRTEASLGGEALSLVHVGPVAVHPRLWLRGLGRNLMLAVEERAAESGADATTLTTNVAAGITPFYEALGYRRIERFVPWVRDPQSWRPRRVSPPTPPPPALLLREQPVPDPRGPLVRRLRAGESSGLAVRWPVVHRSRQQDTHLHTLQLLRLEGPDPDAVVEEGCRRAHEEGVRLVWGRPDLVGDRPGFQPGGGPGVDRLARGITERGRALVARARGYRPASASP